MANSDTKTAAKPEYNQDTKQLADLKKCLELQVGRWGELNTEYGGFEIAVNNPTYFPWYDVIATLLKFDFEVWVTKKKDRVVIIAKPPTD